MDIIDKIKNYKKTKSREINKILNIKNNYNINFKNNLLQLSDNNNKILASEFIFFGIYQPHRKLWLWSNTIPGVSKLQINKVGSIKLKSYLFENNNEKTKSFIYQLLTNDVIEINDEVLLDTINETLQYLSGSELILKPVNSYGNIQFIGLTNIKEKYY